MEGQKETMHSSSVLCDQRVRGRDRVKNEADPATGTRDYANASLSRLEGPCHQIRKGEREIGLKNTENASIRLRRKSAGEALRRNYYANEEKR